MPATTTIATVVAASVAPVMVLLLVGDAEFSPQFLTAMTTLGLGPVVAFVVLRQMFGERVEDRRQLKAMYEMAVQRNEDLGRTLATNTEALRRNSEIEHELSEAVQANTRATNETTRVLEGFLRRQKTS